MDGAGFLRAVNASDAPLPVFTSVELMMMRSQNRRLLSGHFLPVSLGALLMTAWIGASPASGQSFDCRNARHTDEKTICRESRLGELDKELSAAYDKVGGKLSKQEREEFENNETAFVNARHRCGEHQGCIEQSYRNRLQELRAALPDEEADRSGRRATSTKRSNRDRDKTEERVKTEDQRAEPRDAKPGPIETTIPSAERKAEPGEAKSATALPPPPPAETRSRHKEIGSTGSAVPNPPSREEAQAAIAAVPAPEKHDRHEKRSRHKETVSSVPASPVAPPPEHDKQPTMANTTVPERHPPTSGSTAAAAQAPNPPERRHSKTKTVATGTPSSPEPHPAPAKPAGGSGGTQWVNPSPSP